MHTICDPCFKKAGPLEEKTKPHMRGGSGHCAYCHTKLEGQSWVDSHYLTGDIPFAVVTERLKRKRIVLNIGDFDQPTFVKCDDEVIFEAKPGEGVKVGMLDVARTGRVCSRVPNPHAPYECSEPDKCCNPGPRTKEE